MFYAVVLTCFIANSSVCVWTTKDPFIPFTDASRCESVVREMQKDISGKIPHRKRYTIAGVCFEEKDLPPELKKELPQRTGV